jgi:casein kinase II subunit alpha
MRTQGANVGVILEHVDNTDFRTLYPRFSDIDIQYYTHELLKALEFAHGQGIMHRDIRPHNVVIDHQNRKVPILFYHHVCNLPDSSFVL